MADKTDAEKAADKRIEDLETQLKTAQSETDKWKALSRKNEERATENADKAKKFDEIEESSKSEVEKERAAREKAEKALADRDAADEKAKADADAAEAAKKLRDEVATTKKVDPDLLAGSTKEELEAHADKLLKFKGVTPGAPGSDGQGDTGDQVHTGEEKSAEDIVAEATKR